VRRRILLVFWLLLIWSCAYSQQINIDSAVLLSPQPVKGFSDFIWEKLLTPEQFKENSQLLKPIPFPGSWKDIGYPDVGYGTYRLKIHLPKKIVNHSILFSIINSSAKVWVNGRLVDELGVCDLDPKKYKAKFGSLLIALPSDTADVELIIQVIK